MAKGAPTIEQLLKDLLPSKRASDEACEAYDAAKEKAVRACHQYKNPGLEYDIWSPESDKIDAAVKYWREHPDTIPEGAPREALLACNVAEKWYDKSWDVYDKNRGVFERYLGGEREVNILNEKAGDGNGIRISYQDGPELHTLEIPESELTAEGLLKHRNNPALKDSPIWKNRIWKNLPQPALVTEAVEPAAKGRERVAPEPTGGRTGSKARAPSPPVPLPIEPSAPSISLESGIIEAPVPSVPPVESGTLPLQGHTPGGPQAIENAGEAAAKSGKGRWAWIIGGGIVAATVALGAALYMGQQKSHAEEQLARRQEANARVASATP